MSFVSVIIPCYNAEKYIEKCLNALNAQTYKNFDVIIVDDCSLDNTGTIIKKFNYQFELKYNKHGTWFVKK